MSTSASSSRHRSASMPSVSDPLPSSVDRSETPETLADEVLWGAQEIADFIRRNKRQTYHLLEQGHISADKCGAVWTSTKSRVRRRFDGEL